MRTPVENKSLIYSTDRAAALAHAQAVYTLGGPCPRCGRSGAHCRPVEAGYWCQEAGLIPDESGFIAPTPDPTSAKINTDPAVVKANAAHDRARAAFDAADQKWQTAVGAAAAARITVNSGTAPIEPEGLPRPPLAEIRAAMQTLPGLEEAASDAFEARELAARALDTASIERNDALGDALEREGRPRHTPRSAPPRESVYVPSVGRWI